MKRPSHIAADGSLVMVDVGAKATTERVARAESRVRMSSEAATALREATLPKGDALVAAQVAGILAAKRTADLIPLAHPLPLTKVDVTFEWTSATELRIEASARTSAQTGVEMEALDKAIVIDGTRLLEKRGGKSGAWSVR